MDLLCDIDIVAVLDSQDVQLNVSEHLVPKIATGISPAAAGGLLSRKVLHNESLLDESSRVQRSSMPDESSLDSSRPARRRTFRETV